MRVQEGNTHGGEFISHRDAARVLARFGRVAALAVGALLASGAILAVLLLGGQISGQAQS